MPVIQMVPLIISKLNNLVFHIIIVFLKIKKNWPHGPVLIFKLCEDLFWVPYKEYRIN